MANFVKKHKPEGIKDTRYIMTNLKDIHFQPDLGVTSKSLVLSLLFIGIFLIITACINFVNLATAQALKRSKEVGVRKVMGSTKSQLFWQFMFETALIALISLFIALLLFYLALPLIKNNLTGIFKFTFYFTPSIFLYIFVIILAVIVFSGSYPAFVLGGFRPVMALKGKITTHQLGGFSVRRGLVVLQFAISQMLIIGMLIVANQLNYFTSKDLGFKNDAILTVQLPIDRRQDLVKMSTFKNLVNQIPSIEKFSYSMSGPPQSGWTNSTSIKYDNRPENEDFSPHMKSIDDKYCDLYQIKYLAGRNLMPSDTVKEVVVNETMVKKLGLKKPEDILNKIIVTGNGKKVPVVGVIKDFHMSSLHQPIAPLFMTTSMTNIYYANLKLSSNNYKNTIASLEKAFNKVYVDSYFKASFVDEQIAKNYETEQTMGKLINLFAIIAILIGCLGLYGLVSFMAAQKTKEIGIRKVLGANETQILSLFGNEFGKLILIAFAIAAPIAWYFMDKWLQDFEYRESINTMVFIYALVITLLIALFTIGYQAIKAAWANPVKSLRSE